jgi:hypothetical protein
MIAFTGDLMVTCSNIKKYDVVSCVVAEIQVPLSAQKSHSVKDVPCLCFLSLDHTKPIRRQLL